MNILIPTVSSESVEALVFDLGGVLLDVQLQRTLRAFEALDIRGLVNETDYSWHCAIKTGEKVSRCDTIVFCFMNNVSWRKEWLSIWIP